MARKMAGLVVLVVLAAQLTFVPLLAQDGKEWFDATTGKPAASRDAVLSARDSGAAASRDASPLARESVAAGNVLWDLTHGVYLQYEPANRYSMICDSLRARRYTVATTSNISAADLSAYTVLVISLGSAWEGSYTTAERDKIVAFVQKGGGLLVMGDNPQFCPDGNLALITETFGITLGLSNQDEYSLTGFSDHYICGGLTRLNWQAWGDLGVNAPASAIILGRYNRIGVAVAEAGAGRVVVTGDINFCDNEYHLNYDNKLLTYNIFDWLAQSTHAWTGDIFDFNDGTTQGWTHSKVILGNGVIPASNLRYELKDEVNYPNAPGKDPVGDGMMSLGLSTPGGLGMTDPGSPTWGIVFYSPELAYSSAWQNAAGVGVRIAEGMGGSGVILAGTLAISGFDQDALQNFLLKMEHAETLIHDDFQDDQAVWNHLTFTWSGLPGLPANYIIHRIALSISGTTAGEYLPGGLFFDAVAPVRSASAPNLLCTAGMLDFGVAAVGQWPEMSFLLSNTGNAMLLVDPPLIAGPDAAQFQIVGGAEQFRLRPGSNRTMIVRFAPGSAGAKSAQLRIASNDQDDGLLIISLTGMGTGESGRKVSFVVATPPSTPAGDLIYLAGNFNAWDPGPGQAGVDGQEHNLQMEQIGAQQWRIDLPFPKSQALEYKYTRGRWDMVEKGPAGEELSNRLVAAGDADLNITDAVAAWADVGSAVEIRTDQLAADFGLRQNYPNPFNPVTLIRYDLPRATPVRLTIHDARGRQVRTLVDERQQEAGEHHVLFDASGLASGLYLCHLRAGTWQTSGKMLLLR
ncbi:MAG TPA: choice-of-anchor D domain-containing protein [bacterium]|nr:choice-of-anchor D domain-containing protein [bacterium]